MKLLNILLAVVLTVSATVAQTESALQTRNSVAGTDMFSIGNVSINCTINPEDNNLLPHYVWIYGHTSTQLNQYDSDIIFIINGKKYPAPSVDGTRMNKNAWVYFIDAIGEATKFDVLVNGKKVDSYTANIKNVKKTLGNKFYGSCWNTWFQE